MLIEFRVENHRSLRDEQVLSMEAGRVGDDSDPRPRIVPGYPTALLPVAAIYGANASGKSNVLAALAFMRDAVVQSHRFWSPDEGIPTDAFAWGPKKHESSTFEVTFLLEGIKYEYGFVASEDAFLEEWLFAWPNGHKQVWLERENNDFRFGENLNGENETIEEVTRPNALFLSAAVQHKHVQLEAIFSWFRTIRSINFGSVRPNAYWFDNSLSSLFLEEASNSKQRSLFPGESSGSGDPDDMVVDRFRTLLRHADIGIVDVRVDRIETEERPRRTMFRLKHQSTSEDSWLPLAQESRGTQTLFRMAMPILHAVIHGGILIVDELEASLHPSLAQEIVRQFNDPATNPHNAQLIFTTHDTNLLGTIQGEPALRRDQVWLTEKSPEGATELYPLTDYKPRKNENLERGYVQGRYGAVPFLGDFLVTGERI